MIELDKSPVRPIDSVLKYVRPAVRKEKPYLVGGIRDVEVKLNQNESPWDFPDELKRELLDTFASIPFNRYPEEHPETLRRALAERLDRAPESILIGNGSNELSYLLGLTLVEQGVPVVLPRPMFSLFAKVIRLYEGALAEVSPRTDLSFDAAEICAAIRRIKPALTIIASPNNPTGLAMSFTDLVQIIEEADGVVVIDEAYVEFNEERSVLTVLDRYPNLVIMRTFSKAAGLAGLRVGYLAGHPAVIREFAKARLPFVVDRLAEAAALLLLRHPEVIQERVRLLKASCRDLLDSLCAMEGVDVVPSQANFVIFKTSLEPAALITSLANAGVLVRDVSSYPDLKGYVRVNAGTPDENQAFLAALKRAL
jgi:histidinol-phosphate aminotransferase